MSSVTLPPLPHLAALLHHLLHQVPHGFATTFGDLAEALGDLSAARWVAAAVGEMIDGPWHRVVRRTGELASADEERRQLQIQRLMAEHIAVSDDSWIDLAAHRWTAFVTNHPLRQLAAWQLNMANAARCDAVIAVPREIAGLDVSYVSPNEAVAAYVVVSVATGDVVFSATHRDVIRFPYIPGYLTFRELPMHVALLDRVRGERPLADVILVDGAGQLHPRRSGIAVAVGVVADCRTIGVAKHRLCGRAVLVDGETRLEYQSVTLGAALMGTTTRRPLDVSPGQGMNVASAVACVRGVWPSGRSPLPIAAADRLSRQVARRP